MKFHILFGVLLVSCSISKNTTSPLSNHFPSVLVKPDILPEKENFYLYILAGQSNMAGRGFVQPEDTVSSTRVLTLNQDNIWVYAKEPLHYYESSRTGLDCGLSFGKEMTAKLKDSITVGLIPCAVGGSSIEQWINDSTYRGVTLYKNLLEKIRIASQSGKVKGILWHQGESNAGITSYVDFKLKVESFFKKLRKDVHQEDLPVFAGQLGSFLSRTAYPNADLVNNDLKKLSKSMPDFYLVKTKNLTHKPDTVHFDTESQRILGKLYAKSVLKELKVK
ncbi:MAG: sialate O-acetylesterase [Saprospiraceae bacterium]